MTVSIRRARGRLLPGGSSLKSPPHLLTALLGLLMVGIGCGDGSRLEEDSSGKRPGRAALAAGAPTCVSFQRGASAEVADAKISNRQPDKSFGREPVASTSQLNGQLEQVLLRFDTSSITSGATVTSATLSLSQVNSGRPTPLRAHAITGPWSEHSVTWSSFGAAYDPSVAASLDASGPAHPSTRTLDITGLVGTWVHEPSHNHGLLLEQPEGKTLLDTSESPHADRRPRLEVCYTEAPQGTIPAGTSLLLRVVDAADNPISAAAISSQEAIFPTDSSGHYLFENLPPGRFFARVDAPGYTSATAVVELREGAHAGYQVKLLPHGERFSFEAGQGASVETEQVHLTLPPGAVVDALGRPVTGTVEVSIVSLDPTTQRASMPGPLTGITSSRQTTVQLESFFMAEVSLWHQGAPVQLAPGALAALEFVLPDTVAGRFQPGDTVPGWWFDLDAGVWREEGLGFIQPSQSQPGKRVWAIAVRHFTWWNSDRPWTDKSCVNVLVVDPSGQPVPDMPVNAQGTSYVGWSSSVNTGADGHACIEIMRGGTAQVFAGLADHPLAAPVSVTGTEEAAVCGAGACTSVKLVIPKLVCVPGAYQACPYSGPADTLGKGLCKAGRQQCDVQGMQWNSCQGEVLPATESCQSPFDEDCDGSRNEFCVCTAQLGQPCYTGPAGTQDVGVCKAGTVACDLFGNPVCVGQSLPRRETCATPADEDCDGSIACMPGSRSVQTLAGTSTDKVHDVAFDGAGNMLVLGMSSGTINLGGALLTLSPADLFVAKLDADGQHVWSQRIGREASSGDDRNRVDSMAVDGAGNVLISGTFTGSLSAGGTLLTSPGHPSLFVVKFSSNGSLLWAQGFGGDASSSAWAAGIAVDAAGNAVVTGEFDGTLQVGGTHHSDKGFGAFYVLKLQGSTGEPSWSRSFDAVSADVTTDAAGAVWVTGNFSGVLDLGGKQLTNQFGGVFVAKFDGGTGGHVWSWQLPNAGWGESPSAQAVRVDSAGNVLLLTWWPARSSPAVLMKLSPSQEAPLWQTGVTSHLITYHYTHSTLGLTLDSAGNPIVTGWLVKNGMPSAFLFKYGSNLGGYLEGEIVAGWSTDSSAGSFGVSWGRAGAAHPTRGMVLAGSFIGTHDFGTGPVASQGRSEDIFLLKFEPTP